MSYLTSNPLWFTVSRLRPSTRPHWTILTLRSFRISFSVFIRFDLILSGHNHDLHIDFDGRTAFVESEQDANYVTVVDIDVIRTPDSSNGSLAWWPEFRIIDTANIDPDPKALAKVRDYQARLEKQIDAEITTLGSP